MSKEMLINVSEGEECRIALLEDGRLEELYMERTSSTSHVGNIYKGRVTNVEPSIQAAFVDFGLGRNGFLHISDLMPSYFGRRGEEIQETVGRKMARRDRPPIQRCLRRGDEIVVQIIKEGIGTKGPTLSTYLSIPGKMLVMMPGMGKMGVSKKIEDEQERRRLRQILDGLKPPKDVAFIIRTAGVGKTKAEIERDLKYLTRLWETLVKKEAEPAPVELYTEGDLVTRTVRDMFSPDVERIVVDNKDVARRVKEVIKISSPRAKNRVDLYEDPVPLFHKAGIEGEIEQMYSRHVPLPSGGSLVIDSTEAVVAIDVNSGKNRENNDAEMTAFKTDMEAADEIPRQLKLRDLGGVIICDFIDLRFARHREELFYKLFENFKNDRAKTKVLPMSQFGIIQITRQRMRPSLKRSIYFDCPHCKGAGLIKTPESISLDVMRKVSIALADLKVARVELSVCPDVAFYLLNKKRATLTELETRAKKKILIRTDASLGLDELKFELFDSRDFAVVLEEIGMTLPTHPHTTQLRQAPSGGRSQRDRNDRGRNKARPVPARAMEDDDDLDEDLSAIDDRDQDPMDPMPTGEREEDPTDIPAILETEAGDEVAEELADEEDGEGQGGDDDRAENDMEDDSRDRSDSRPQQRQPQHRPNHNQNRQQNRPPGQFNNDRNAPRHDQGRTAGQGTPQARQGVPGGSGDFGGDQGGTGEGGSRRRRRRRGRRGRGGQGQQMPGVQDQGGFAEEGNENFEPNGNINHDARGQEPFDSDEDRNDQPFEDVERTDEIAQPSESGDQPAVTPTGEAESTGDQPPRRRRRRRGGRRHRRRNADGTPINNGDQQPVDAAQNSSSDTDDEFEPEDAVEPEPAAEIPAEPEPVVEEATVVEETAVVEEAPETEPEPEVKPKSKRASRAKAASKAAREPKAAKTPRVKAATKRTPPKKKATAEAAAAETSKDVAVPTDVVRTGSADKHLISDEPVLPPSLSRPRSYSDLDAIPDDYD
jgi:ribonuclease E